MKKYDPIKLAVCLLIGISILACSNIEIGIEPTTAAAVKDQDEKDSLITTVKGILVSETINQTSEEPLQIETVGEVTTKINEDIWMPYENSNYRYRLQHPQNSAVRENGPVSFSPDEVPDDTPLEDYLVLLTEELGTNICTTLEIDNGFIAISAPVNKGNRYAICGPTGTPAGRLEPIEMSIKINGKDYSAKGTEVIGKSENDTLDFHSEMMWIELENGITISFGTLADPNIPYSDYLKNTQPLLIKILETFELYS